MRNRLNIYIIFIVSSFTFVCLASEIPANRYLNAVRTFADNVLKYGRDTYGPKHTPLFVDGLNIHTHEPVKWIAPNGDRWILSNLASQQNLFRTLDALTTITGDPKYKQAAMDAIKYAFENLRSPNGLLYWGGHAAYDAAADKPCGRGIHELKGVYPYYELMWEVDPQATKQFIEAFWSGHILDWSNLDMDRHAWFNSSIERPWVYEYSGGVSNTGLSFIVTGTDLSYAATWLAKFTGDERSLVWGKRLAYRYVETRNPKIGISSWIYLVPPSMPFDSGDEILSKLNPTGYFFPGNIHANKVWWSFHFGYDTPTPGTILNIVTSPWICELMLGDLLGQSGEEFIQWSTEELTAWGKVAYRSEDNAFVPTCLDGTVLEGYVCKEDGQLGLKGTSLEPVTAGSTEFWAYALAYCLTTDEFMWEMARNIAIGNNYGDLGATCSDKPQLNLQTDIADPYMMWVFLELHRRFRKKAFLSMAIRIGDNILNSRFHEGFVVPSKQHTFTKFDCIDTLALSHLYSAIVSGDSIEIPKIWPASSFFENPYRDKDGVDDNQLIYTLKKLSEPPKSLQEVASEGNREMVRLIIAKGTAVDSREDGFRKTALHRAAIKGHKDVVELLLNKGADINARDSFLCTPLHYAVENNSKDIADLLVTAGADMSAKNGNGQTPLDIAVRLNRKDIIGLFISKGAEVSIHTIVRLGDASLVRGLLEKGTDVNAKNNDGQTALDVAMDKYNQEIAKLLIANGAEVSIQAAAFVGDIDKVKAFLERGSLVDTADATGQTLLHLAAAGNHKDIVELLISNGANVNVIAGEWKTPLTAAIGVNSIDIAEYLIAHGANVNANECYWTPIQEAAEYSKEMVELLLAKGANINAGKFTALHNALDAELFDIVELLIDRGADINIKDDEGRTPLHIAAQYAAIKNPKIVELLISKGADINAKDNDGKTALAYAVEGGHTEIAEILRKHGAKE